MKPDSSGRDYMYGSVEAAHTHAYLSEPILGICRMLKAKRVLDVGCGTGSICAFLTDAGIKSDGCDPSESGILFARERNIGCKFELAGVYDDPVEFGLTGYDVLVSTEVIEHLFAPRALPRFAQSALQPGGHLIISTPYHGYLKNLALSITNKWDFHHTPLWDGGHIKFWSRRTLSELLESEGFEVVGFVGAGRIPYLWKSMILIARKRT